MFEVPRVVSIISLLRLLSYLFVENETGNCDGLVIAHDEHDSRPNLSSRESMAAWPSWTRAYIDVGIEPL